MTALAEGFRRVASFGYRTWRPCLVIAAIVACTAPLAIRDLRIETDSASLVGPRDPVSRVYRETLARFGDANPLIVQIRYGSTERRVVDRFTDRLADRIRELPAVSTVEAKVPAFDPTPWSIGLTRAALFNSEQTVLDQFTQRLEADEIRRQLRRTRKRLLLADAELRRTLNTDVLGVTAILLPFYEERLGAIRFSSSRYYDAPDRRSRLLFVQSDGSADNSEYCEGLLEELRQAIDGTWSSTAGAELITARLTGKCAVVGQSAAVLRRDMLRISVIALALVLTFVLTVFRGWRATLICTLPILLSLTPVLWLARLVFDPLNFFAVGFIAIVMGLGVDAMLHCTARTYQILAEQEVGIEEATGRALADCGPPVLIGTVSTAAAFLCLGVSSYQGLAEFGRLTAAALVLSFCSSMVLLPAVIRLLRPSRGTPDSDTTRRLLHRGVYLFGWRRPGIALSASAALVVVCLVIARGFTFDPEFRHLLPDRLDALDVADDISRQHGSSFLLSSELLLEARSFDQGVDLQRSIDAELKRLVASGTVLGFQSPLLFRAGSSLSPEKERLREQAVRLLSENRSEYERALTDLGFAAAESHRTYYDHLIQAVASTSDFSTDSLAAIESDPRLRRFFADDESGYWFRTLIWLPDGGSGAQARSSLASRFDNVELGSGARLRLTGTQRVYEHVNEIVGSDFMRISGLSIVIAGLLLVIFFRSAGDAMLGLLPILAAIPVILGVITISGIPVPPLGVGMMAIVFGIGIDDAVHLLARPKITRGNDFQKTLTEIGPIITLTSLTSVIGFGALSFASHQVLSSLGVVVAIGILACWLFSIVSLPACYRLLRNRRTALLLLVGILGSWASPVAAQSPPTVDDILQKIERNRRSVGAVSCSFDQQRKIPELIGEIEVTGQLTFKAPNLLRITWEGDENLDLYADGTTLWLVDHDLGEVDSFAYDGISDAGRLAGLVPPVLLMPTAQLRERFQIRIVAGWGSLTRLEFKARDPATRAPWSFILDVDDRGRIQAIEEQRDGGELIRTQFRKWRRLPDISDHYFRYRAGAGK